MLVFSNGERWCSGKSLPFNTMPFATTAVFFPVPPLLYGVFSTLLLFICSSLISTLRIPRHLYLVDSIPCPIFHPPSLQRQRRAGLLNPLDTFPNRTSRVTSAGLKTAIVGEEKQTEGLLTVSFLLYYTSPPSFSALDIISHEDRHSSFSYLCVYFFISPSLILFLFLG